MLLENPVLNKIIFSKELEMKVLLQHGIYAHLFNKHLTVSLDVILIVHIVPITEYTFALYCSQTTFAYSDFSSSSFFFSYTSQLP